MTISEMDLSTNNFKVSPASVQISPSDSAILYICFKPQEQGEIYLDTLQIFSNDINENPAAVLLEGRMGTFISGEVSGLWTIDKSPFIIQDIVTVPSGSTLRIEAGVKVKFKTSYNIQNGATLKVKGTLIAIGTHESKITFTRLQDDGFWGSILLEETGNRCILEHCIVSYGSGTQLGSYLSDAAVTSYNSVPSIKNSLFTENVSGICLFEKTGDEYAVISGNTFTDNQGFALINEDYNTVIKNNIFYKNSTGIATMVHSIIENNTVVDNYIGLWLRYTKPIIKNCIVWNNSLNVDDRDIDYSGKAVIIVF